MKVPISILDWSMLRHGFGDAQLPRSHHMKSDFAPPSEDDSAVVFFRVREVRRPIRGACSMGGGCVRADLVSTLCLFFDLPGGAQYARNLRAGG